MSNGRLQLWKIKMEFEFVPLSQILHLSIYLCLNFYELPNIFMFKAVTTNRILIASGCSPWDLKSQIRPSMHAHVKEHFQT